MPLVENALGRIPVLVTGTFSTSKRGRLCPFDSAQKAIYTIFRAEYAPLTRISYFMGKTANFTPRAFSTKGFKNCLIVLSV